MEAGGHYYTVYYTSLAVGFSEKVAFRHALLSQMPDQVSWMDAADMHIAQCKGSRLADFDNVTRNVPVIERYRAEYGLHSLPDKNLNATTRSSAYQRRQTTNALLAESPVSLKFGLLLHRLGDTYAHSRMGNEQQMYTVSTGETCFRPGNLWNYDTEFGHGHDGHKPDFPFLRRDLYYSYLKNLYDVLYKKVTEPASASYKRNVKARQYHEVKGDFEMMFMRLDSRAKAKREEEQKRINRTASARGGYIIAPETSNDAKADMFIEEIRNTALRTMRVEMKRNYAPEKERLLPLPRYLEQQKSLGSELDDLNINSGNLTDTIIRMMPRN
jgi:hypothetical protein